MVDMCDANNLPGLLHYCKITNHLCKGLILNLKFIEGAVFLLYTFVPFY